MILACDICNLAHPTLVHAPVASSANDPVVADLNGVAGLHSKPNGVTAALTALTGLGRELLQVHKIFVALRKKT